MTWFVLIVISTVFWAYVVFSSILLWLIAIGIYLLTFAFDRRRKLLHLFISLWAYHYVWLMPLWKVRIIGRERIQKDKTYVIVANHQSLLDILVLFGLFRNFKWVSKQVLFRIPIVGWSMSMCNYVALTRGLKSSINKMMRDCRKHLDAGSSVLIFPEGTRSEDGQIKKFREGAFILAKNANVEIVPIAVNGTSNALPKNGIVFKRSDSSKIQVHVLEPIDPKDMEPESLTELVYDQIRNEVEQIDPTAVQPI